MVRLKICCIATEAEAALAIAAGADAVGVLSNLAPGGFDDPRCARIVAGVPRSIASFLLTGHLDGPSISAHLRAIPANTVQIVDHVAPEVHETIRRAHPSVQIVQVVHVTGPDALDTACRLAPSADALLLDSGRPGATFDQLGGTGRTHDWGVSRAIVDAVDRPVWLAGGLNATNVTDAIRCVRPHGVDLCSGVRTDGRLDPVKLHAYVAAVRAA